MGCVRGGGVPRVEIVLVRGGEHGARPGKLCLDIRPLAGAHLLRELLLRCAKERQVAWPPPPRLLAAKAL